MEELELIWRTAAKGIGIRAISGGFSGFDAAAVLITVKQPDPRGGRFDTGSGACLKQNVLAARRHLLVQRRSARTLEKKADGALESAIGLRTGFQRRRRKDPANA
jgi:hypothetical protein